MTIGIHLKCMCHTVSPVHWVLNILTIFSHHIKVYWVHIKLKVEAELGNNCSGWPNLLFKWDSVILNHVAFSICWRKNTLFILSLPLWCIWWHLAQLPSASHSRLLYIINVTVLAASEGREHPNNNVANDYTRLHNMYETADTASIICMFPRLRLA